jgi:hypothetical protein
MPGSIFDISCLSHSLVTRSLKGSVSIERGCVGNMRGLRTEIEVKEAFASLGIVNDIGHLHFATGLYHLEDFGGRPDSLEEVPVLMYTVWSISKWLAHSDGCRLLRERPEKRI